MAAANRCIAAKQVVEHRLENDSVQANDGNQKWKRVQKYLKRIRNDVHAVTLG
jgi:hypothetical protein